MGYFSTFLHIVSWCEKKQQQQRKVFLENHFVLHCGCQVYVNRASRTCSVEFWIFFASFFDVIHKTQNRAFKADDMFESNPVKRGHFTELLKSVTSGVCEIGSENTKKPEKEKPQRNCNRLIYLFILSALGHCYHDNSLMACFASLFLIFFFTPLPSYLQYLCLKNPHDRCNSTFPFATHCPLLFIPNSPLMKACSLKEKIQKKKNQGVNRLQERQRSDGLEMMQHQSVCVRAGFLPSDKNETEQGSLQYQRPLSPVICWEHGEWSLMLFCYQLSSVSLQMNCWYRLMSYSLSLLFFFSSGF